MATIAHKLKNEEKELSPSFRSKFCEEKHGFLETSVKKGGNVGVVVAFKDVGKLHLSKRPKTGFIWVVAGWNRSLFKYFSEYLIEVSKYYDTISFHE